MKTLQEQKGFLKRNIRMLQGAVKECPEMRETLEMFQSLLLSLEAVRVAASSPQRETWLAEETDHPRVRQADEPLGTISPEKGGSTPPPATQATGASITLAEVNPQAPIPPHKEPRLLS